MAAAVQQSAVPVFCATPDVVANAFVHQYYLILHQSPQLVHQFYHDVSKLGRPESNGAMGITTTMKAINEKILSLASGQFMVEITTVDAQESYNGGVLVLVTGYFTTSDYVRRKFTQTFFLAPQDKGYFVLNDVLRYIEDAKVLNDNQGLVNDKEAPLTSPQGPPVQEQHILEQSVSVEEVSHEEVYNPPENVSVSVVEDETPVPEVVNESPDVSQVVVEPKSNIEEIPKKSYASIVKFMKETPSSSSELSPMKSVEKSQEQQVTPSPDPASDTVVPSPNAVENGNSPESETYGYSIYIKNLPLHARAPLLDNEFKKFGPIKHGGIQVRSQRGFCFGFVEFEMESSMQSAIEASPITIGGRQAIVEQKKSTNRGNSRGRFSSVRGGGYRNEGVRGGGNNGDGRDYAYTDSDNANEFGNRGYAGAGFTNRRGDGYQRTNRMGDNGSRMQGNGSRMHRASGATVNATAGNTAQRVSVQA